MQIETETSRWICLLTAVLALIFRFQDHDRSVWNGDTLGDQKVAPSGGTALSQKLALPPAPCLWRPTGLKQTPVFFLSIECVRLYLTRCTLYAVEPFVLEKVKTRRSRGILFLSFIEVSFRIE